MGRQSSRIGGLALVAHSALAWSNAAAADLIIEEPSYCIARDALAFRVERSLGQPLADVEEMQLFVSIGSSPAAFVAQLEVERRGSAERGTRTLRAASCEALSEALAVAIVVAIGGGADAPTAPVAPAPTHAPDETSAGAEPVFAAQRELPNSGPTLSGAAWMVGDTGTLPAPGLGLGLGVGVAWPGVEVRALGTWLPQRERTLVESDPSSPGTSIGLVAGSVMGCVPVGVDRAVLGVVACAGWEVGQLSGSGTHVSLPYEQRRLWSAARFDVVARWSVPATALGLDLSVTATAPFTRDEFFLQDLGSVHRPASVSGRLGLGISVAVD